MEEEPSEYTLKYLLAFDDQIHIYQGGYWLKFEITKREKTEERPHGLSYSFTLHGPDNERLVDFDNAHSVPPLGSRFKKRSKTMDHWHRTVTDEGRPYEFKDAETLINDFFDEVERVLQEHGIPFEAVEVKEGDRS